MARRLGAFVLIVPCRVDDRRQRAVFGAAIRRSKRRDEARRAAAKALVEIVPIWFGDEKPTGAVVYWSNYDRSRMLRARRSSDAIILPLLLIGLFVGPSRCFAVRLAGCDRLDEPSSRRPRQPDWSAESSAAQTA
jgi:hypothetical protein